MDGHDYFSKSQKLASCIITNRSWIYSPSPCAVLDIFFKFYLKFEDEKWIEDEDSLVFIGRSDAGVRSGAYAQTTIDKLSFTKIHDSIEKVLERLGVQDCCWEELILFAWDDVYARFGTKPITGTNVFDIDIEVVVRRPHVSIGGSLRGSSCSICLEDLDFSGSGGRPLLRLPACSHFFHRCCIHKWLSNSDRCPLCRRDVNISALPCDRKRVRY
ncbi:hypothetical protein C2S53_014002 [Perilla frutescens var. hirtella]|uniref:RING-type domain-containing protein n=1 Tax=Perilla frutescens var. hirtella TaxID=608512 RepID=A0AAD4IZV6_PERFH|nr:hypothetical protein C2S53_014002 [Perilla frutescens var. hirtella]